MLVTIATVPTATLKIIPDAIKEFRARGHAARIRISDLSANEVLKAVEAGEVDFGINIIGENDPALDFQTLCDDAFILVMHPDDPQAAFQEIAWQDIDQSRFVAVWRGSGNRILIESGLARAKQKIDWAYEVRHLSTALALAEAGIGITALPQSAIADKSHAGVVTRPLINPVISRKMGTIRRADHELSAEAKIFIGIVHESSSSAI